jgi:hypothetical protein
MQLLLWQSTLPEQPWPFGHFGHVLPQSTPVSVPFRTVSVQLGGWHTFPVHTLLTQSLPVLHDLPLPHFTHVAPPQSIADSEPFLTPSVQVGAWQTLPVQTPLTQSPVTLQAPPVLHPLQVPPPQSMAVSAPFLTPSEQVGA